MAQVERKTFMELAKDWGLLAGSLIAIACFSCQVISAYYQTPIAILSLRNDQEAIKVAQKEDELRFQEAQKARQEGVAKRDKDISDIKDHVAEIDAHVSGIDASVKFLVGKELERSK